MLFKIVPTCTFVCCLLLSACGPSAGPEAVRISGQTMGTTFSVVTVGGPANHDEASLRAEVETVFADVNASMSNWDENSEISRFNKSTGTKRVKVSPDLLTVIAKANEVHTKSNGKFDVTLGPLIELWGFGTREPQTPVPSDEQIAHAMAHVGQLAHLSLDISDGTLAKMKPAVEINLSALAKGFGIDAAAEKLTELGFNDFMVEIGGDLRTSGKNERGRAWRVGIEKPETASRELSKIVELSGEGMATSGDYRNFVEAGGKRFSHIIDPVNGRPIEHLTTSVTVIADNAMQADAWATALLVLGADEGMKIANQHDIAAYFISRDRDLATGQYVIVVSNAFEKRDETH